MDDREAYLRLLLGKALKAAREERGLTQAECGEALGIAGSNWAEIESGRRLPSLLRFAEICYLLRFDPVPILDSVHSHF